MQLKNVVKKILHKNLVRKYEKKLHKEKISYETYITKLEWNFVMEMELREGYLENKVQVVCYPELDVSFDLGDIQAEYVLFYAMDGKYSEFAKRAIWYYFEGNREIDFVYGDEDSMDHTGRRYNPYFKPDWSPTEYEDSFYVYGMFAIRKSALKEEDFLRTGNWLRNLVHLCDNVVKRSGGMEQRRVGNLKIGHLPYVLFHRMNQTKRTNWKTEIENLKVLEEKTKTEQTENLVSVVILSKNNYPVLRANPELLFAKEKKTPYEIVVVDNGSEEETRELLESYCKKHKITYLYEPCDFNFSYLCNKGAKEAKGNFLLFMNDDVEPFEENFMEKMCAQAEKEYVGAVGCKLLYPGTTKIQHAGIVNLPIGPMHKLQFERDNENLYFGRNKKKINCIAVTAACLMIEKEKFVKVGGFSEELAVAYNDVALGFSLEKEGYYNVCLNDICLYHHESLSRGSDSGREKMERLLREQKKLYELYPQFYGYDPYYSKRLARDIATQRMEMKLIRNEEAWVEKMQAVPWKKKYEFEENSAIFETIEWILEENNGIMVSGYTFAIGADNATFDREMYLVPENTLAGSYKIKLNRRLRMDVAKNVKDQKHVEMCGFCVSVKKTDLEPGTYLVCIGAKEHFGKVRLWKTTNRCIVIE